MDEHSPYIFNVQRFCLQDGPGVRTTVFFKGCPLRCDWCSNPESQSTSRELLHFERLCARCGACVQACPKKAITITPDRAVHSMDRSKCDFCGRCVQACNTNALEFAGKAYSIDELLRLSLKDLLFWEQSKGGVTLSGGEPLLHPAFLLRYLKRLKAEGVHTAVETTGFASTATIKSVSELIDLFIYDIKHLDDVKHAAFTGVGNLTIIENCKWLMANRMPVLIRVPVIPSFNMSDSFFQSLARFISELHICKVDLLPFHRLGAAKYTALGREYRFNQQEPLTNRDLLTCATSLKEATGCTISIDGSQLEEV